MANDDAKLKFLPRHLQRSQPAIAHKSKRRVTVEDEIAGEEDRRSVFDRLGPGASSQRTEKLRTGFDFPDHTLTSHSGKERAKRDTEDSPDSLKLKFKGGKDRETKVKSQVVVRGKTGGSDDESGEDSDGWSMDKLEDKKELELEQKRLEIQRALKALEGEEIIIETRKSDSSDDDNSPERVHKKKKDRASKKKEKKKHKKNLADKESPAEKAKEGKRKHDSDDDDEAPHKKKKKKNKDKKHVDVTPPPLLPDTVSKQKKSTQLKSGKAAQDLYDPESPTSVARGETPSDKCSLTESPKVKAKSKKKKKKLKSRGEPLGKSKKLLSPLKKVLKLKMGSASAGSSRRSRSVSHEVAKRVSRSRSSSSSSSSSSSQSPARRKKSVESSGDRGGKKAAKPVEKKKRGRSHRSSSTSSSTSSSSSSSLARSQKRPRKITLSPDRSLSRTNNKQRSPAVSVSRKDTKVNKKNRRGTSADAWTKSKDRGNEVRQERQSLDRGRDKQRGRNANQEGSNSRRNFSQPVRAAAGGRLGSKEGRKSGRALKGGKAEVKGVRRRNIRGMGKAAEAARRERMKERERDSNLNREKKAVSLDREKEEATRRGSAPQNQQGERGGNRFSQRGGDEGERRHFEEPSRRFGGNEVSRLGQFGMERQRPGLDRGSNIFARQRERFEMWGWVQASFSVAGRGSDNQSSVGDQGQGRGGRNWDERGRRDASNDFRDDRSSRVGGFGTFREDSGRMFGGGVRDEKRPVDVGREDRTLLHFAAGGDSNKSTSVAAASEGRDRSQQRGQGFHEDHRESSGQEKRDWKLRESSGDASKQSSKERDRSGKDEGTAVDLRQSRTAGKQPSDTAKDKPLDKDKSKNEKKSTSKQNVAVKAVKSESPIARDEPSLASLFSQTDNVVSNKKKQSTSFGGRKSSNKKLDDPKTQEKPKAGVASRSGLRIRDSKTPAPRAAESTESRGKDSSKDDKSGKKEDTSKDKMVGISSPRNVPRSGDARQSLPRSLRKSKSPEGKRGSARSPTGSIRPSDSTRSPKPSHSPAPAVGRDKDKERSNTPTDARRKTAECKKNEKSKNNDKSKTKREKSKSLSGSDSESRLGHSGADEKQRRKSSDSESLPAKLDGGDIAAAMLGDGLDDGQQDVFSDWTDDDAADLILVEDLDNNYDFDHIHDRIHDRHNRSSQSNVNSSSRFNNEPREREPRPEPLMKNMIESVPDNRSVHNAMYFRVVVDSPKEKPAKEKRKRNTEDEGYEEISSDENDLDEEGEKLTKRTIVSLLNIVNIDIGGVMPAPKPTPSSAPVFQRFKPASLFSDIGLSQHYAGDKLYQEVQETCQRQLQELAELEKTPVNEPHHDNSNSLVSKEKCGDKIKVDEDSVEVKTQLVAAVKQEEPTLDIKPALPLPNEPASQTKSSLAPQKTLLKRTEFAKPPRAPVQPVDTKPTFKLYSNSSAYHKLYKAKALERSHLLANFGMFRRALTARKDLEIRRQLCRIDPKYDQSAVYPSGVLDPDNFRLCLQLFKQKKPGVLAPSTQACVA